MKNDYYGKEFYQWLNKIEEEAKHLGVNYFIAAAYGKNCNAEIRVNNNGDNINIAKCQQLWNDFNKSFREITFKDLYDYIQKADRNAYGYHFPKDTSIAFHIYHNMNQMNICIKDNNFYKPICNFIFDSEFDIVKIANVNDNGISDYDNMISINWNKSLTNEVWVNYVGENAGFIKTLICEAIVLALIEKEETY